MTMSRGSGRFEGGGIEYLNVFNSSIGALGRPVKSFLNMFTFTGALCRK
jgi:hypothetical protein